MRLNLEFEFFLTRSSNNFLRKLRYYEWIYTYYDLNSFVIIIEIGCGTGYISQQLKLRMKCKYLMYYFFQLDESDLGYAEVF